jgi:hypothetical protein
MRSFAGLEKRYAERSARLYQLKVAPAFDGLRSDSRFAKLLRRVGLEE